jgi:ABC-type branched-subunit amino acid transport system substrate-binding protein
VKAGEATEILVWANRAFRTEPSPEIVMVVRDAADALAGDDLEAVYKRLDSKRFPASMVAFRMAKIAEHIGDLAGARRWLGKVGAPAKLRIAAEARRKELLSADAVDRRVAVLLPLSGRYGSLGKEVRLALELAFARSDVKLVFLDTEGVPETASAAVDQAVNSHGVAAIIGPLGDKETRAAVTRALSRGVPIAVLTPGVDPSTSPLLFRLVTSPTWEAVQAANLAVDQGYDALAVLAPRDDIGGQQARAFVAAAKARGVRVVKVGRYDPTATDLEPDLRQFLGLDPKSNERLRRHLRRHGRKNGWKTFSPDIEFDLLYVPDRHDRAALVASYLPFFNVEVRTSELMDLVSLKRKHGGRLPSVVQLLGSSGWHHQSLFARGGSAVEGALLVDTWAGGEHEGFASGSGAQFAEAFKRRRSRYPTALAAQAFDAGQLVRQAMERSAKKDLRRAFSTALSSGQLPDGVCGSATVDRAGAVARDAFLIRADGGEFVVHN